MLTIYELSSGLSLQTGMVYRGNLKGFPPKSADWSFPKSKPTEREVIEE